MAKKEARSQAALEFLTTYAWAFLVILIMVGALAYFGILKPSKLLPDRCNFGSEIQCLDYSIFYGANGADGQIKIRLRNNLGEVIQVDSFSETSESSTPLSCTDPVTPSTWESGGTRDLTWTICNTLAAGFLKGDKAKALITIEYHTKKSSTDYKHKASGEVFTTVQ